MLPIIVVLLAATSALAAPYVGLSLRSINEIASQPLNGHINGVLTDRVFEISDGGDNNVYIISAQSVVNDLANLKDPTSQAYAIGQTLAILTQLSTGIPGDACASASVIDAYVNAARSGRPEAAAGAVRNYIQSLVSGIDRIVLLANNPKAARNAYGPRGGCVGGGRTYSFESAWDYILSNVPAHSAGLLNEQYCSAKRLYNAFSVRNNNVGADITATSLGPVNAVLQRALGPITNFLVAVATGNGAAAAGSAKHALLSALN